MTFPELFEGFTVAVLPHGVSEATQMRFQAVARYASARAGDTPFTDNDRDQIVYVAAGSTKLVAHASHGREQVVAFHFAGDLVSVPARAAHAYTLCALADCQLVYFRADEFLRVARLEARLVEEVLGRSMRALSRCREKAISLGRKSAQERLAGFLVTMAERIGSAQEGSWILDLPMSRRDIADSLGLTIETISRQLGELREAGLIETEGRSRVKLLDLPALSGRAGHIPLAA